jgi:arginyl-tRNA synthetase
MVRNELKNLAEKAVKKLYGVDAEVKIDRPQNAAFGDFATNVAMTVRKNPQEIADAMKSDIVGKTEVKNGFINFFISEKYLQKEIKDILKKKESFGIRTGCGQKVNVEFISANPTGPLTLGNGRGGFCGDVLANVLQKAGYEVKREYYINDAGEQVRKLGHSVLGDAEAVYKGSYIEELKKKPSVAKAMEGKDAEKAGKEAAKIILEEMIKPSVKKMGIDFDDWFFEQSLYGKKEVDKVLEFLKEKNLTYESEGALWFKSTEFGDNKDRVLIKADGEKTYLASDIAYLKNKFERGFGKLIFFWGADHYGYIERIKAAAVALGYKKEQVEVIIMQLVRLIQGGQEVKMSKRSGIYVTTDELLEEVGLDAARFFFLMRGANSHLNFDLDLAKEQSDKNPVYYVQYAHARICSIIAKARNSKSKTLNKSENSKSLNHPAELDLAKKLISFPEIIEDTAKDYQLQRIPQYATDLATAFHRFYQECRVISEDNEVDEKRLELVCAVKIILENTLKLMGISAPEKM